MNEQKGQLFFFLRAHHCLPSSLLCIVSPKNLTRHYIFGRHAAANRETSIQRIAVTQAFWQKKNQCRNTVEMRPKNFVFNV